MIMSNPKFKDWDLSRLAYEYRNCQDQQLLSEMVKELEFRENYQLEHWRPCTPNEYEYTGDGSRVMWGPDLRCGMEGWRVGDLPRTEHEIMNGLQSGFLGRLMIRKDKP